MVKVLPPELSKSEQQPIFRFEDYSFTIPDQPEEREKRFTQIEKFKRK
jgi:hypothetical protein